MTLRALIVDDEPLSRERVRMLLEPHSEIHIAGECSNGEEAVAAIAALAPDLVFLDVQMPGMDGFEVLERLGAQRLPAIIFVTAYDAYAIRAFDVNAVDYLLKPLDPARLAVAVDRVLRHRDDSLEKVLSAVEAIRRPRFRSRFVVRDAKGAFFLPAHEIDWLEAADNYVRIHTRGNSYLVRETLKNVEATLDPERFVRVHRSAIVAVDCVERIEPYVHGEYRLTLRDGTRLTSSRAHSDALRALLSS